MRQRLLYCTAALAIAVALVKLGSGVVIGQAQRPSGPTAATKSDSSATTPWGEPDLQGIWAIVYQIPLQRPAKYAGREFFTDAEIAQLDKERAGLGRRDARTERGSEADVAGAYNAVFNNFYHTGRRTSLIVDPPDGRMPPLTPAARERIKRDQEFQGALNQATDVCKQREAACGGAKYGPPSPRRAEVPPSYQVNAINRADNPEDTGLQTRCLITGLPDFGNGNNNFGGNYRRIVQTPGAVSMFVDFGQGHGFHRAIPITTRPHLTSNIRQWWGDSRARWEGNTLVVDVTNFTAKSDYFGSRENLHLIERYTRTGPDTLEYALTLDDPTTWTTPWTMKQDLFKQPDEPNRIYYEPRCHEGNYGLAGILLSGRAEDNAFAEGRGPNPATRCVGGGCRGGENEQFGADPLQ
jgi:hypothetical protein